jgi:hypothetical protein
MAAVALAVAIPVTLLIRGGGDDGGEEAIDSTPQPPAEVTLPLKPRPVVDESLGIEARVPEGWTTSRSDQAIRLQSPDRTAEVAITAPGPAAEPAEVLHTAVADVRRNYQDATGIPNAGKGLSGKRVGNLPASSAALLARTKGGTQLRILLAAASGESHAYLVEVFSALESPDQRLVEAQTILNTLQLTG